MHSYLHLFPEHNNRSSQICPLPLFIHLCVLFSHVVKKAPREWTSNSLLGYHLAFSAKGSVSSKYQISPTLPLIQYRVFSWFVPRDFQQNEKRVTAHQSYFSSNYQYEKAPQWLSMFLLHFGTETGEERLRNTLYPWYFSYKNNEMNVSISTFWRSTLRKHRKHRMTLGSRRTWSSGRTILTE